MTIYKQIDAETIQFFVTNEDGSVTNGPIVKGRTRTRQVQTGTQEVESGSEQVENGTEEIEVGTISVEVGTDDEGNPIFEDQMQYETVPTFETVITYITEPVFETETYSPWDELMLTDPTIEPIPQAVIDAELVEAFKRERQTLIANAVVTTEAGNQYDADETSVIRLGGAITRYAGKAGTTKVLWSLADTATGFMSEVTLADLKEAHALAVDNITAIWGS
jgi:hypothetical protein